MSIQRISLSTAIALGVGGAVALGSSANLLALLTQAIIYAVFAIGVGLLLRQNGMVSFGHALFFGSAGYFIGILLQLKLMPAEAAILVTLLALTLMAFVMGLVIVRVPGIAFGMLTLAIGQMFYLTASRSRGLTGSPGCAPGPGPDTGRDPPLRSPLAAWQGGQCVGRRRC